MLYLYANSLRGHVFSKKRVLSHRARELVFNTMRLCKSMSHLSVAFDTNSRVVISKVIRTTHSAVMDMIVFMRVR